MNWKDIKINKEQNSFIYKGRILFNKDFTRVMKFHEPGIAPVYENNAWYYIKIDGKRLNNETYNSAYGFYEGRASVRIKDEAFHIDIEGNRVYSESFQWTGNFQDGFCSVRDKHGNYFHINKEGKKLYEAIYKYVGDFREGIACVMLKNNLFTHINKDGSNLHNYFFKDIGVFHKGIATAKDDKGWFHINLKGESLYSERYSMIEPFYNDVAFVEMLNGSKNWITL